MKPLTPFQKKLARWTHGKKWRKFVFILTGIIFLLIFLTVPLSLIAFKLLKIEAVASPMVSALIVLPVCFLCALAWMSIAVAVGLPMDWIFGLIPRLPEKVAEDAMKFLEEHPEHGQEIQALIQEAYTQDDGSEQRIKLEKFKILAGKEKSLADLPNQDEKLKTEISALEKELGL